MIDLARAGAVERPDGEGMAGGRCAATGFGSPSRWPAGASCGCASAPTRARSRRPRRLVGGQAEGASLLAAARLGTDAAVEALGFDATARSHVEVAVDALSAALGDAVAGGASLAPAPGRAIVAMSGGVDSALVLAETAAQTEAVGLTLRLWIDPDAPDPERACCAPTAVRRARDACHARGVAHLALDLREAFRDAIVDPFVAGYAAGETPNPCVRCNGDFRFDALLDAARRLGGERLLTGHYARVAELDGMPVVARGADPGRTRATCSPVSTPAALERVGFPLGASRRTRRGREHGRSASPRPTRPRARRSASSVAATTAASCAAPACRSATARSWTRRAASSVVTAARPATPPGQRRGVGVSGAEPLYVLRTDVPANVVVVAPSARLGTRRLRLDDVQLHVPRVRVDAKLRYRSPAVPARVAHAPGGVELHLERPAFGVAPGQTAALYDGDAVVGAGTIALDGAA